MVLQSAAMTVRTTGSLAAGLLGMWALTAMPPRALIAVAGVFGLVAAAFGLYIPDGPQVLPPPSARASAHTLHNTNAAQHLCEAFSGRGLRFRPSHTREGKWPGGLSGWENRPFKPPPLRPGDAIPVDLPYRAMLHRYGSGWAIHEYTTGNHVQVR
jgi:hypothetical protein